MRCKSVAIQRRWYVLLFTPGDPLRCLPIIAPRSTYACKTPDMNSQPRSSSSAPPGDTSSPAPLYPPLPLPNAGTSTQDHTDNGLAVQSVQAGAPTVEQSPAGVAAGPSVPLRTGAQVVVARSPSPPAPFTPVKRPIMEDWHFENEKVPREEEMVNHFP